MGHLLNIIFMEIIFIIQLEKESRIETQTFRNYKSQTVEKNLNLISSNKIFRIFLTM